MANITFNVALGAVAEKIRDGANIQVIAISATNVETDAVLKDKDTVTDVFSGATDEATNAGYARKSISNASITLTVDDTLDKVVIDIADQTFSGIGAAPNWSDLLFCEDAGGADGTRIPLSLHDFSITTDGTDVVATVANFWQAS